MSVYFIANIKVTSPEEYQKYLAACDEVFQKFGGKYLSVDDAPIILEGDFQYTKTVLIEFQNQVSFDEWYHSQEYQRLLMLRLNGSESDAILVHGTNESIKFTRTRSNDSEFQKLISLLDEELRDLYGDRQDDYSRLNVLEEGTKALVVTCNGTGIGTGSLKELSEGQYEIKRVYITKAMRGRGISKQLIKELEIWAKECHARELLLETGIKQIPAINLYQALGFKAIENYGEYRGNDHSVCMRKIL